MEIELSLKHQVIKNQDYTNALNEYLDCIGIEFEKIKKSKNFDSYLHNPAYNKACLSQANVLKDLINGGALDYGNFTH